MTVIIEQGKSYVRRDGVVVRQDDPHDKPHDGTEWRWHGSDGVWRNSCGISNIEHKFDLIAERIEHIKPAPRQPKIGDRVKVFNKEDRHCFDIGHVGVVTDLRYGMAQIDDRRRGWLHVNGINACFVDEPVAQDNLPYGHVRLSDGTVWDMTADKQYPFGMLTQEQREAMQAHGGPYHIWGVDGWKKWGPSWMNRGHYRVAPKPREPVRVTVADTVKWRGADIHVTVDYVDGKPDWSTLKAEGKE